MKCFGARRTSEDNTQSGLDCIAEEAEWVLMRRRGAQSLPCLLLALRRSISIASRNSLGENYSFRMVTVRVPHVLVEEHIEIDKETIL